MGNPQSAGKAVALPFPEMVALPLCKFEPLPVLPRGLGVIVE